MRMRKTRVNNCHTYSLELDLTNNGLGNSTDVSSNTVTKGETTGQLGGLKLFEGVTCDKSDKGKLRFDLLPAEWLTGLAEVATYGANKYTDNGWKKVNNGVERYYAAALRHITAWRKGEEVDPESGLPHLIHAAWNCLAVLSLSKSQV